MSGVTRDPTASERDPTVASRSLTPPPGVDFDEPAIPSDTTNEDFLFHLYRGSELLQDDRVHEAKEELERALVMQPRDAKGQDLLAIVYFRLGHYPRAIAIYEQLRRSNPRDHALMLNLALCYLKTGQPSFARRELAELVKAQPAHLRAWGYLGLACERLGDLEAARAAFERGGHGPLVRRMEARLAGRGTDSLVPAPAAPAAVAGDGATRARAAVAAAFEELDAGELSFALAEPESDTNPRSEDWQSLELGHALRDGGGSAAALSHGAAPALETGAPVSLPHLGAPAVNSRRPTLIAPAAPAAETAFLEAALEPHAPGLGPGRTLPPALHRNTAPLPAAAELTRESVVVFPPSGEVVVHASGVALVRTGRAGFHVRPEALRVVASAMTSETVLRRVQGRQTGEPLGGLSSPIALFAGDGQLVVGPRPGRKLSSFLLQGEVAFVREDLLLGFDGALAHESGRVTEGTDEPLAVVQLEGSGAVILEALGELLGLDVTPRSGLLVRREAVVAWFGRLVPRVVPHAEAPGGQRGLLSFGGEGSVLFGTA